MTEGINMNNFKEPTSVMAGTNIIFSIGSFMYLYKRLEQIEKENADMRKNLNVLTSKLQKYTTDEVQTEEGFKIMHERLKTLGKTVKKVDELRIEDELKAIKSALADSEISVKSPKLKRRGKKYKSSSSDTESSEELPKKKLTKSKIKEKDSENDDIIDLIKKVKRNEGKN